MSDEVLVKRRWFSVRSLATRMTLVFAGLAAVIWVALAIWVLTDALRRGEANLTSEMREYAHQVMAVAERWPANDPGLAGALEAVINIENQANQSTADESEPDQASSPDFLIQIWRDGQAVLPYQNGLNTPPNQFDDLISVQVGNVERKLYAVQAASRPVVVALLVKSPYSASITWPSVAIVLLPLVISLPVLLIPAWLMTRFGLRPLRATTDEVLARVTEGKLTPLELTRYRELNPLLQAMNQLMARLSQQLKRERAFVADVAHELKTPLAALQTNIGTAVVTSDAARRQAALNDLDPSLKRTTHLVQQLLDMARLEVDETQDRKRLFDLAEFCRERLSELIRLADCRDIQLKADIPEQLVVLADPDPVSSIVTNLVDNAIKYSPAGGLVVVSLVPLQKPVQSDEPSGFVMTVTDQGDGIALQDRAHVFERFYRCTASALKTEGAGLGMAIVKRAVTLLGGRITLADGDLNADAERPGLKVSVRVPA